MPTPSRAPAAREALLAGLVDYAGLFPPAALPLSPVVETYGRERAGAEAWMLGRLVVPAATLPELEPHRDVLQEARRAGAPWPLAVLGLAPAAGPVGETADGWLAAARDTLAAAHEADRALGTRSDRFELRLPPALARDADGLAAALADLARELPGGAAVAVEVPFLAAPDATEPAADAVAHANRQEGSGRYALKLRCGGETAGVVPGVEALAAALTAARRAGVAVKATAGLHHPLRGMADTEGVPMHGFVNVFGGAALAARHGLDADALAEILDDGDPARWRLDDALAWRRLALDGPDVARAREAVALSFGSCSFDEPRDDLRALGWL